MNRGAQPRLTNNSSPLVSDTMTMAQQTAPADPGVKDRGGKYLTFFLDAEEYGIEILSVREIIGLMAITPVPRTPHFIRGVINLRGKVIPIIDLRLKFAMASVEPTEETCIIVVQSGDESVGLIVDKVSEVVDIPADDVVDAPSFGAEVDTAYILGIGKAQDSVKLLLDIGKVLAAVDTLSATASPDCVTAGDLEHVA